MPNCRAALTTGGGGKRERTLSGGGSGNNSSHLSSTLGGVVNSVDTARRVKASEDIMHLIVPWLLRVTHSGRRSKHSSPNGPRPWRVHVSPSWTSARSAGSGGDHWASLSSTPPPAPGRHRHAVSHRPLSPRPARLRDVRRRRLRRPPDTTGRTHRPGREPDGAAGQRGRAGDRPDRLPPCGSRY